MSASPLPSLACHALLTLSALALPAFAQVDLSGDVFDGSGGPLTSGQTYHVIGQVTVPAGETLTIPTGVNLKFLPAQQLRVKGTLDVNGSALSNVQFTSVKDDAVGGDTNADGGATLPAAGDWSGIVVDGNGAVHMEHASVRYAGNGGWAPVYINGANTALTLSDCLFHDSSTHGMNLTNRDFTQLSVTDCAFADCNQYAVTGLQFEYLPGFSSNTASGCGSGSYLRISQGTVATNTNQVVTLDQLLNDVLVLPVLVSVPSTSSLELAAGVTVKLSPAMRITVTGAFTASGTPGQPVIVTTLTDDTVLGDTNVDGGATTPSPGELGGIVLNGNSSVDLDHTEVRYAGNGGWAPVYVNGADTSLTLDDCVFRDALFDSLELTNRNFTTLTVANCQFLDGGDYAVAQAKIEHLLGFSGNTASGNGDGDYIQIVDASMPSNTDLVITHDQLLNGVLALHANVSVVSTSSLSLPSGLVVKVNPAVLITITGSLVAAGTEQAPISFTPLSDDTLLGDTNEDGGATSPAPGAWAGLRVMGGATLDLAHTELRYGGNGGWAPVYINGVGATVSLDTCTLSDALFDGLDLAGNWLTSLSVTDCSIIDCGQYAVASARMAELPGFSGNTASGCALGDIIQVTNDTMVDTLQVVEPDQLLGGLLALHTSMTIHGADTLQILEGVDVKLSNGTQITVAGTLDVDGSGRRPVTFTSLSDDEVLGDTNKDGGATTPAPGAWAGLVVNTSGNANLDHVVIRYPGNGGWAGVYVNTSNAGQVDLDAVRVERSLFDGFYLRDADGVRDCVAWDCGRDGFVMVSETFDLDRCTAAGNQGFGVKKLAAHTGNVESVISWGNAGGNYDGVVAGELRFSLGHAALAGIDGNTWVDPLFVDQADGDLRLGGISLAVDTGDPADMPNTYDAAGMPRWLDGRLDKNQRVDMGAYEYGNVELALSGDITPGGSMTIDVIGTEGLTAWLVLGVEMLGLQLKTFGRLDASVLAPSLVTPWGLVPSSTALPIPVDAAGMTFYVQAVGVSGGGDRSLDAGNTSNLEIVSFE
jgi:uncharacterized protein YjbI with pentapeptide repeats